MQEALEPTLRYMQRQQGMHRIMANYMPHNQRSGQLLARLGFEKEGYAKDYLMINGRWRDHVLTALTTRTGLSHDNGGFFCSACVIVILFPPLLSDQHTQHEFIEISRRRQLDDDVLACTRLYPRCHYRPDFRGIDGRRCLLCRL